MCGIVGVLGHNEVAPLLVEALKRLEYRGYDSAGIATVNQGRLDRRRAVGKLVNLSDLLVHQPLAGKAGIGHTRWATHGVPSVGNAHPHQAGPVAVVHNGIIENYLKQACHNWNSIDSIVMTKKTFFSACLNSAANPSLLSSMYPICQWMNRFVSCFILLTQRLPIEKGIQRLMSIN